MQWITRERPKIDRIACPGWWRASSTGTPNFSTFRPATCSALPRNRCDPYDIPGVELSHVGELSVSTPFSPNTGWTIRRSSIALIVRGADTSQLDLTPQSPGLYALSLGLSQIFWTTTKCSGTAW